MNQPVEPADSKPQTASINCMCEATTPSFTILRTVRSAAFPVASILSLPAIHFNTPTTLFGRDPIESDEIIDQGERKELRKLLPRFGLRLGNPSVNPVGDPTQPFHLALVLCSAVSFSFPALEAVGEAADMDPDALRDAVFEPGCAFYRELRAGGVFLGKAQNVDEKRA
ncbi:hypothetical protein DFH09DRAFT_1085941 [Mycena vulgaris]|nr:hypothetical protein DFH09DRAFT_1085941 [Mycena vulgaris]